MKYFKFFILIIAFIAIVMNITACGRTVEENTGTPVVSIILYGKHANSQCFDVQLETSVQQVYASFGNMGIIVVDGNPSLLRDDDSAEIFGCYNAEYLKKSIEIFNNNNVIWQRDYLMPQTEKMIEKLDECKADDSEVDTLEALCTAVDSLNAIESSMGTKVKKELIILDTGLCTSGTISFLNPDYFELLSYGGKIWEEDVMEDRVQKIMEHLEEQAEIPNLKGVSVTWYGLGQVGEPQQSLSKLSIQNLQYFWGELLTNAGALPSDKANTDERYGMFVSAGTYGIMESEQYVTPIQYNFNEMPVMPELPEQKVNFIRNSDEYLSLEEEERVRAYASELKKYPDMKILLAGTTSSYNGGSLELSEERAKKVKKTLVEENVLESNISIIGLGYNLNVCQDDSPEGQFEESIAKGNRSVLIFSLDSQEAQKILSDK